MEQDEVRDEALAKIAEKWREAAALGCVDALECALREAWQASREAVVVVLPVTNLTGAIGITQRQAFEKCRRVIHAAGIGTR